MKILRLVRKKLSLTWEGMRRYLDFGVEIFCKLWRKDSFFLIMYDPGKLKCSN